MLALLGSIWLLTVFTAPAFTVSRTMEDPGPNSL
jgi:hypothetical protein